MPLNTLSERVEAFAEEHHLEYWLCLEIMSEGPELPEDFELLAKFDAWDKALTAHQYADPIDYTRDYTLTRPEL